MEQTTSSNGKQRFLIIGILVLVALGLFYSYWSRSSVSKLSELDRVAAAMVDVWCFNLKKTPTTDERVQSSLTPNTENEKELKNIFKKYGFKNAEEFEKTGEKYKGSDEFAQKIANSEKYIACTQESLSKE